MIYLICIIFVRAIRRSSCRGRYTHILEPDRFDGSQNARAWLENVESFLEGKGINDGSGKCLAVLSRLSSEIRQTITGININVKEDYKTLHETFLRMYGGRKRSTAEYLLEFSSNVQDEKETLYHYYAELSRVAKKAFPDCNDGQRRKFIDERFMSGLFNDALRTKLMETYKYGNFFSKMFSSRSVLERALELDEIFGSKRVDINLMQQRGGNGKIVCYKCHELGHYSYDCWKIQPGNNQSKNLAGTHQTNGFTTGGGSKQQRNTRSQNNVNNPNQNVNVNETNQNTSNQNQSTQFATGPNQLKINAIRVTDQMVGNCAVNGRNTKFLADTGANKTVIDASVLSEDDLKNVQPCLFKVILADSSEATVLGLKKCFIKLGFYTVEVECIITKNVSQTCLLGVDFLFLHPATKKHIVGLQKIIDQTKLNKDGIERKNESYNIQTTLTKIEECNEEENDWEDVSEDEN